jgi:hypothetical protein
MIVFLMIIVPLGPEVIINLIFAAGAVLLLRKHFKAPKIKEPWPARRPRIRERRGAGRADSGGNRCLPIDVSHRRPKRTSSSQCSQQTAIHAGVSLLILFAVESLGSETHWSDDSREATCRSR